MPLTGVIDFKEEARRLNREMDKLSRELAQAQKKLANERWGKVRGEKPGGLSLLLTTWPPLPIYR